MIDCIARISEYTRGGRTEFFESRLVQDAVLRNLQTLAESGQRLSNSLKSSQAGIPWQRMAGMRNILVHAYLGGIDRDAVWAVIERHLPDLNLALKRMRETLS